MDHEQEAAYHELCAYTLTRGDATFIHQHVVDAFAIQHAGPASKPIQVVFALAGLYLHVERGLSGRQVQQAHMRMARTRREWPALALPESRGAVTASAVLAVPAGDERDRAIDAWAASVWDATATHRGTIEDLLRACQVL